MIMISLCVFGSHRLQVAEHFGLLVLWEVSHDASEHRLIRTASERERVIVSTSHVGEFFCNSGDFRVGSFSHFQFHFNFNTVIIPLGLIKVNSSHNFVRITLEFHVFHHTQHIVYLLSQLGHHVSQVVT